jgi:hypothetical protein
MEQITALTPHWRVIWRVSFLTELKLPPSTSVTRYGLGQKLRPALRQGGNTEEQFLQRTLWGGAKRQLQASQESD